MAVLIVEHGAGTNGAGLGIDMIVDEVEHAFMREARFVGEADLHPMTRILRSRTFAALSHGGVAQEALLVAFEIDVDAVE